ncbi:hypothetical protein ACJIZ3_023575 [Penstemon smallii]|uniref:RNase H type-1 domain-containing protein n=1 Tax=Penstemon smallii TaxID=265156 RepID=A0ABD3TPG2_9LAMI
MDANYWIKRNITRERFDNIILPNIPWCTMFIAIVWAIWKSRNKFIFRNTREPTNQVIFIAKGMAEDMMRTNGRKENKRRSAPEQVKWSKPQVGWFKLNTDGSLLRDDAGNWVVGFSRKLGEVTITMAELLAIREGLSLAWEKRIPRLVMESDSEVAVKLINEADVETHPLGNIIIDCRSLIRMPWECRLAHKRRSSNVCADALARKGHNMDEVVIWEDAPEFVLPLLLEDIL